MNECSGTPTPAERLVGKQLPNGWLVEKLIAKPVTATGGHFSTSYIVRSATGREAFLKAIDYRRALDSDDPAEALQQLTAAYNFERALLEKCKSTKLSRIVQVIDSGRLPAQDGDPSSVVQYLVFELADGDVRSFVDFGDALDNACILATIHQATAAVRQLHNVQVAHQDLKPSNVLLFGRAYSNTI